MGQKEAHILFASCDGCDGYEVILGGHDGKDLMIMDGKQKLGVVKKVIFILL